jgi:hypothetical protein
MLSPELLTRDGSPGVGSLAPSRAAPQARIGVLPKATESLNMRRSAT